MTKKRRNTVSKMGVVFNLSTPIKPPRDKPPSFSTFHLVLKKGAERLGGPQLVDLAVVNTEADLFPAGSHCCTQSALSKGVTCALCYREKGRCGERGKEEGVGSGKAEEEYEAEHKLTMDPQWLLSR